jgi:BioD-like phosphotransacetylase family protein
MTERKPILVSSTTESTGKTGVALALAREAKERGEEVGYMKPKGTTLESAVGKTLDKDPMVAREVLGVEDEVHEMEPVVYSPTFVEQAYTEKSPKRTTISRKGATPSSSKEATCTRQAVRST